MILYQYRLSFTYDLLEIATSNIWIKAETNCTSWCTTFWCTVREKYICQFLSFYHPFLIYSWELKFGRRKLLCISWESWEPQLFKNIYCCQHTRRQHPENQVLRQRKMFVKNEYYSWFENCNNLRGNHIELYSFEK